MFSSRYLSNLTILFVFISVVLYFYIFVDFKNAFTALPFRDDTPHVPNEDLGESAVLDIIGNLTEIIMQVFPGKFEFTKGHHRITDPHDFLLIVINSNCYPQTLRCTLPWVIMITTQRINSLLVKASFMRKLQNCGTNG